MDSWLAALDDNRASSLFILEGPTSSHRRRRIYDLCPKNSLFLEDWLAKGIQHDLSLQLSNLFRQESVGLLGNFLLSEDIIVEYPLLSLVDQGFQYTSLFKALWEIKFLFREESERAFFLLTGLERWLSGNSLRPHDQLALQKVGILKPLQSYKERLDMFFFLLTLARQQGFRTNLTVVVDGLECLAHVEPSIRQLRLQELYELYRLAEQWLQYKSGVGIVFGLAKSQAFSEAIQDHSRLAQLIEARSRMLL